MEQPRTKALFIVTNPVESPGERYRIYQYLPNFEMNGVECLVSSLFTSSVFKLIHEPGHTPRKILALLKGFVRRTQSFLQLNHIDVAVVYRDPIFLWPGLIESLLMRAGVPYIFDFDDAIYLPIKGSNLLTSLFRPPTRLRKTIRNSACTVAGNRTLALYARQYSDQVEIIPTSVDTNRFVPGDYARSQPHDELVIGWMGSQTTAPYLHHLDETFSRLAKRLSNIKVVVVGGDYQHPTISVECRPWSLEREVEDLQTFDVGIMPLPDDPWARGKCGLKILQYMAVGLPVIASPVGVNAEIIQEEENGLLAGDTAEWVEKLTRLTKDPELRLRLGKAGRAAVEKRYSSSDAASRYLALIQSVARKNRDAHVKALTVDSGRQSAEGTNMSAGDLAKYNK